MILSLAASVALAQVEPCVPEAPTPPPRSVLEIVGMGFPDPLSIHWGRAREGQPLPRSKFVTDRELGERRMAAGGTERIVLAAIPLGRVPGRSLQETLAYAGAIEQRDGSLRLRGGEPRIYVDGIRMRSDLE